MNKKRNNKNLIIAILLVAIVITSIFILIGKSKTEIIKLSTTSNTSTITKTIYNIASTPYATIIYIGNGTAKVGGFHFNNITIDNKTFAIPNSIPLYAFSSKNETLYYIKLVNFSNYNGIIIPASFMNNSDIAIPLTINPFPSCPIIPAVSNPNDIVFNKFINNTYAYTGVLILKNTTAFVGNKQYPLCYKFVEIFGNAVSTGSVIPSGEKGICSVNDANLNCTYYNNYSNLKSEISIYPQIK